jgi:addiction module HigA family antidote
MSSSKQERFTYKPVNVLHPGEMVTEYLDHYVWSQQKLALRSGLDTKTISEVCSCKERISPPIALALEKVFGRPAHFWLNLQQQFDEAKA